MKTGEGTGHPADPGRRFPTTRWTVIRGAVTPGTEQFRDAFSAFWGRYKKPLQTFLRAEGHSADAAEELLQGFLTGVVAGTLRGADPNEGRFRNYLLRSLENYVFTVDRRNTRLKRGGGAPHLSLEVEDSSGERRFLVEPTTTDDPGQQYMRAWALRVLDLTLEHLKEGYRSRGDLSTFEALEGHLAHDRGEESYRELAERLGRRPETVKVQATRMRDRFRQELRNVVAETVDNDDAIDGEIAHLFAALEREPRQP